MVDYNNLGTWCQAISGEETQQFVQLILHS
jgi:hypothetical protein